MSLRVLLVDARQGGASRLSAMLSASGFRVVGVATEADDLIVLVSRLLPDAIIIDTESPRRDTLEGLALVNQRFPRPTVLMSESESPRLAHAALEAGISAYTVEGASPALVRSLVEVTVAHFHGNDRLHAELRRVRQTLEDDRVVGQAKCLLMEHHGLSERESYARLRRIAMERRQRIVDVAQALVNQVAA